MNIGRASGPTIVIERIVPMFEHEANVCICPGMVMHEGSSQMPAKMWNRYYCEHCGTASPWLSQTHGDSAQRGSMLAGVTHTQSCWTKPRMPWAGAT